ncbi:hypothetical protein C8R44DRAFT_868780 [Mycena epipterygia]|nr:hypothetical protein C8R44DRAFT_868780 [Mycena epipterygia]
MSKEGPMSNYLQLHLTKGNHPVQPQPQDPAEQPQHPVQPQPPVQPPPLPSAANASATDHYVAVTVVRITVPIFIGLLVFAVLPVFNDHSSDPGHTKENGQADHSALLHLHRVGAPEHFNHRN